MPLRKPFIEFNVVGLGKGGREFHYFNDEQSIELLPEPTNEYDKNAIQVLADGKFVGYVSSENTQNVHKFINRTQEGKTHIFMYYLINTYTASARYLIIDLTLSMKRNLIKK